jgi:hypothetical protein
MIVIGVDVHKQSVTAVIVDDHSRLAYAEIHHDQTATHPALPATHQQHGRAPPPNVRIAGG